MNSVDENVANEFSSIQSIVSDQRDEPVKVQMKDFCKFTFKNKDSLRKHLQRVYGDFQKKLDSEHIVNELI
jgi:hypothetical protein